MRIFVAVALISAEDRQAIEDAWVAILRAEFETRAQHREGRLDDGSGRTVSLEEPPDSSAPDVGGEAR